jgi:hypothetical protein
MASRWNSGWRLWVRIFLTALLFCFVTSYLSTGIPKDLTGLRMTLNFLTGGLIGHLSLRYYQARQSGTVAKDEYWSVH